MSVPHRSSLLITQPKPGAAVQQGDTGFETELRRHYKDAETAALERILQLKAKLQDASDKDFWRIFCHGLARTLDAQYCLVAKQESGTEPLGNVGSCLLALCWYHDDGYGTQATLDNLKFHAYACPCSLISHNKVILIPERLSETFPDNPNQLPFPAEAYLAIPLLSDKKYVAHFSLLWTKEALERRKLSWGFVELLCHALEDVVLDRFLHGVEFPRQNSPKEGSPAIPLETIAALHSLKPFARNLSHELRTPMQGIVGMLDIMYSTLADAARIGTTTEVAVLLDELRDSLEVIQASAKRAVEASDNVVEAYALNLGLPELALPTPPVDIPQVVVPDSEMAASQADGSSQLQHTDRKRQRQEAEDYMFATKKTKHRSSTHPSTPNERQRQLGMAVTESEAIARENTYSPSLLFSANSGLHFVDTREAINFTVKESLKQCGKVATGPVVVEGCNHRLEVRETHSSGEEQLKVVEWCIQPCVPRLILIDERMFVKMLSCVFQNALKFTEAGIVKLNARFCQRRQFIVITIKDNGPGIPESFKSKIFQPFAREDDSTTRIKEGLGLGLLVAKGLARKLGGDLALLSSSTSGENRGCEFEMKLPSAPSPSSRDNNQQVPSLAPPQHTAPSSPESQPYSRGSSNNSSEIETATTLGSVHTPLLPHSPPLSPQCATCSPNDNEPCPAIERAKSPLPPATTHSPEVVRKGQEKTDFTVPTTPATPRATLPKTPLVRRTSQIFDRNLSATHPLTFLVAEDNPVNRKLLVNMLTKLGYDPKTQIYEAYDGADAVRKVQAASQSQPTEGESLEKGPIDVVLMDLWMPAMDGYEATERILGMFRPRKPATHRTMSAPAVSIVPPTKLSASEAAWRTTLQAREFLPPTILAVTADATDGAVQKAKNAGMEGFMVKPFRVKDLEKLIREGWTRRELGLEAKRVDVL